MNTKYTGSISHEECSPGELLNPFVHHLELDTTYEKIKTGVLTVILLPIRVFVICFFVMVGWTFAFFGLWGLSERELREKPLGGWRKPRNSLAPGGWMRPLGEIGGADNGVHLFSSQRELDLYGHQVSDTEVKKCIVRIICARLFRCIFIVGGFRLKVFGKQSTRLSAPVVALAPHSSFIDSIAMVYLGGPSIVAKGETASIPFFGKLINFTQPVYVWRDDPDSRHNTIKEIINRATSDLDWPQILIFPEGTCTNRSCLITFKPGAFYPGVPIQPVCIRYPNKLDTVTWTWEGPSALKLLWLTLTQPYSNCEIEFLPVYTPSEEEKKDPKLFAYNVRAVMAKALGIPVIDYSYDDCKLMTKAREMNLPYAASLVEVRKLRGRLGLHNTNMEETLLTSNLACRDCSKLTYPEFTNLLNIPSNDVSSLQLFRIYDKQNSGVIDFREYLLGVLCIVKERNALEVLQMACRIYDRSGFGRLTPEDFCQAVCQTLALTKEYALEVFDQVDRNQLGYITFENFVSYAQRKAEFANLFSLCHGEKILQRNGDMCPNYHSKKID